MLILAELMYRLAQLLILIVLVDIILSYFVPPWNKVRVILDKIVEPMLRPIRKVLKPVGGLDFQSYRPGGVDPDYLIAPAQFYPVVLNGRP